MIIDIDDSVFDPIYYPQAQPLNAEEPGVLWCIVATQIDARGDGKPATNWDVLARVPSAARAQFICALFAARFATLPGQRYAWWPEA